MRVEGFRILLEGVGLAYRKGRYERCGGPRVSFHRRPAVVGRAVPRREPAIAQRCTGCGAPLPKSGDRGGRRQGAQRGMSRTDRSAVTTQRLRRLGRRLALLIGATRNADDDQESERDDARRE